MKVAQHVQLFATTKTVAHQDLLSMEFSWQEYWSGLPFPSPGDKTTQNVPNKKIPKDISNKSVLMRQMNLEPIILNEVSQKEKDKYMY